jgi:hypothetical protein
MTFNEWTLWLLIIGAGLVVLEWAEKQSKLGTWLIIGACVLRMISEVVT